MNILKKILGMSITPTRSSRQEKKRIISDLYQQSLNHVGHEQFQKLVSKGLRVPVVLL